MEKVKYGLEIDLHLGTNAVGFGGRRHSGDRILRFPVDITELKFRVISAEKPGAAEEPLVHVSHAPTAGRRANAITEINPTSSRINRGIAHGGFEKLVDFI